MTIVAIAEAVVIVAIVFLLLRQQSERAGAYEKVISQMADRIQAPERLPVPAATEFVVPEREPDEWATAGQITFDPEYGLSDDVDE